MSRCYRSLLAVIDDLFVEMRAETVEFVIVIDEFGSTSGIVTVEDIVETVVGDILEEQAPEPITSLDDGTIRVRGDVDIDTVNDELDADLPEAEAYETIAGLVIARASRLVDAGDTESCRRLPSRPNAVVRSIR